MTSEMRDLESWHDEDGPPLDETCLQELADANNPNGWSADEMFKYNEKMHKITSTYSEKTLINNYTTALPENNSKYSLKLASKLAKEIEERVLNEGRITPESSDDDELFEKERNQRRSYNSNLNSSNGNHNNNNNKISQLKLQQQQHYHDHHQQQPEKQLEQLKNNVQHRQSHIRPNHTTKDISSPDNNSIKLKNKTVTPRTPRYNNSTDTNSTASLSSNSIIKESTIKPLASSSRNILRTCLTKGYNICV